jgi:hypothetical protein
VIGTVIQRTLVDAVTSYTGRRPQLSRFEILLDEEFEQEVPQGVEDRLSGGTAAITVGHDIYVRAGHEDSAIHELLHAAGMLPDGVSTFINEGLTQCAAEDIAANLDIHVVPTYKEETKWVRRFMLPLLPTDYIRGYVVARDKGRLVIFSRMSRTGGRRRIEAFSKRYRTR